MSKEISINIFDTESIENAISELDAYKKEIETKRDKLVSELANMGASNISAGFNESVPDGEYDVSVAVEPNVVTDGKATIKANGKSALFIEFGTGVKYFDNKEARGDLITPVSARGTYGNGKGSNPKGWFYSHNGYKVRTFGYPSQTPMYNGKKYIIANIKNKAREVFDD